MFRWKNHRFKMTCKRNSIYLNHLIERLPGFCHTITCENSVLFCVKQIEIMCLATCQLNVAQKTRNWIDLPVTICIWDRVTKRIIRNLIMWWNVNWFAFVSKHLNSSHRGALNAQCSSIRHVIRHMTQRNHSLQIAKLIWVNRAYTK